MSKYLTIISIILLFFSSNALAITLDEAIDLGLENSKEYKIEQYYLDSAKNNKKSGMSEFLPEISFSYQTGKKQNVRSDGSGLDSFRAERANTLSLSQPIFNGMRGISTLKKGEAEYLAQKFKLEIFKRELILKIINSYIENLKFEKVAKLARDNLTYYQKILSQVKSKGSLVSENEIIDNKIGYYNAKRDLEELENNLVQINLEYENLTGAKPQNLENIKDEMPLADLEDLLQDMSINPEIMQKQQEVNSFKQAYWQELGNLSPKVNISASYSDQENLVYLDGGDLASKSVFLEVKVPIFQKGNEYFGIKKAKYALKIKQQEFDLTVTEVEKKFNQAFQNYHYAKKSYEQIFDIFNLSKQKLAKNQKSYNLKALSVISLLKAKIERNEAEIRFHEAKANLYTTYYKLKLLTSGFNNNVSNDE